MLNLISNKTVDFHKIDLWIIFCSFVYASAYFVRKPKTLFTFTLGLFLGTNQYYTTEVSHASHLIPDEGVWFPR